jgi:hypothetical protein
VRAVVDIVAIHQKSIPHATPLVFFILLIITRCTCLLPFYVLEEGWHHQMPQLHYRSRQARSVSSARNLGSSDPMLVNGGDHGRKTMHRQTELIVRWRMVEHKQLSVDFSLPRIFLYEDGAADHFQQQADVILEVLVLISPRTIGP